MYVYVDTLKTALAALSSNKVRSALTMLGVIIGVFAVTTLVSIGIGIQNYIKDQFDAIGAGVLFVAPGKVDFSGDPAESFSLNKLDEKHLKLIETYAGSGIRAFSPSIRSGATVKYKSKTYYASIIGASEQGFDIFNLEMQKGRFLTKADIKSKSKVAVIGPLVKKELFGQNNPVGKKIGISGDSYTVVGFTGEKGQEFDDNVYAPYSSIKSTLGIDKFSGISVAVKDTSEEGIYKTGKLIEQALLRDLKQDEFSVISPQDILASIQNILKMVTAGLGAIAGISLFVGGIGIMNIMLVSVTERIREIGLRKAVGATSFAIGVQFLIESVLISVSGGIIGLALGWLGSLVVSNFIRTSVPLSSVALALGFSIAVGVVFGTYPAVKASRKDPIEALRYE